MVFRSGPKTVKILRPGCTDVDGSTSRVHARSVPAERDEPVVGDWDLDDCHAGHLMSDSTSLVLALGPRARQGGDGGGACGGCKSRSERDAELKEQLTVSTDGGDGDSWRRQVRRVVRGEELSMRLPSWRDRSPRTMGRVEGVVGGAREKGRGDGRGM